MMSFYTRSGDQGTTSLYGGARIPKTSLQVEAYGTVDETCAFVGNARAVCQVEAVWEPLHFLSTGLMVTSSLLAASPEKLNDLVFICDEDIQGIEAMIDALSERIGPLEGFVLFDSCESACELNVARTIARRAERRVHELLESDTEMASHRRMRNVPLFLNRASDLLFACACVEQIDAAGSLDYFHALD